MATKHPSKAALQRRVLQGPLSWALRLQADPTLGAHVTEDFDKWRCH